jgi:hypothetical protein
VQIITLLAISLTIVVGVWVGLRLILLASRTGKAPEALVGIALFTYGALCQPAALVGVVFAEELGPLGRPLSYAIAIGFYVVVMAGMALFTWQVFGPQSAWRRALAFGLIATNAAIAVATILESWPLLAQGPLQQTLIFEPLDNLSFAAVFLWMAIESLRYHRLLKRRANLGLADPVVANRVWVWGACALSTAVFVSVLVVLTLNGMGIGAHHPAGNLMVSLSGLANGVGWTLAFMPPRAYLAWVAHRATRANA